MVKKICEAFDEEGNHLKKGCWRPMEAIVHGQCPPGCSDCRAQNSSTKRTRLGSCKNFGYRKCTGLFKANNAFFAMASGKKEGTSKIDNKHRRSTNKVARCGDCHKEPDLFLLLLVSLLRLRLTAPPRWHGLCEKPKHAMMAASGETVTGSDQYRRGLACCFSSELAADLLGVTLTSAVLKQTKLPGVQLVRSTAAV